MHSASRIFLQEYATACLLELDIDSTCHSVVRSTPDEGIGIKPSELLLIAVASCSTVDMVEILTKKGMPLTHLEITSSGEQDQDAPWTFRKIHLHSRQLPYLAVRAVQPG